MGFARLGLLVLAVSVPPSSASGVPGGAPVLHERVVITEGPAEDGDGIVRTADGHVIAPPEGGARARPGEPIHEADPNAAGTGGMRPDRLTPDRSTAADGILTYFAVFNPTIAPFKRSGALDAVNAAGALVARDGDRVAVPVLGGAREPDRDLFWGSMMVRLIPGKATPIPSVAADARVLQAETIPPRPVAFSRDGAGNLHVSPIGGSGAAAVRLKMLVDARRDYFGAAIPAEARLADIPAGLRPRVPQAIRERAAPVLQAIGIPPGEDRVRPILDGLVRWFRGFRPGHLPPRAGPPDLYQELALNRIGVCRHRSYAFTVTALVLGLPTQMVWNEAHAFVEAYVPGRGWMRIDLGGASAGLDIRNAAGKIPHRPTYPDPFPRPPEYAGSYSARELARRPAPPAAEPSGTDSTATDAGGPDGQVTGEPSPDEEAPAQPPASSEDPAEALAAFPLPVRSEGGPPGLPTSTSLTLGASTVDRGRAVRVSGRVAREDGAPVPRAVVALALLHDNQLQVVHRFDDVITDEGGRFVAHLTIPGVVPAGHYRAVASFAGGSGLGGSISDPDLVEETAQ